MKKHYILLLILVSITATGLFCQETIVLGNDGGDGALYVPVQLDEGPDGNIYVFDARECFVKVFSPSGKYLHKMGGRGEGPGEIKRQGSFGFTMDRVFFTEMINGNRWINSWTLSGKTDKVFKLDIQGAFGLRRAVALPGNRFMGEVHYWGKPAKVGNYFGYYYLRHLAIIDAKGTISLTPIKKDLIFSVSDDLSSGDRRIPFFPEFLWAPGEDGAIFFSDGTSNVIEVYNQQGKRLKKIILEVPDAPGVTSRMLKEWKQELKKKVVKQSGLDAYKKYFTAIENYDKSIYEKAPIYTDLNVTPDGNFLLKGNNDLQSTDYYYWLTDNEGKLLAKLVSNFQHLRITRHFILYVTEDEEGNNIACLRKRTGDEKKDLLNNDTPGG
jgi:hypothetical protein